MFTKTHSVHLTIAVIKFETNFKHWEKPSFKMIRRFKVISVSILDMMGSNLLFCQTKGILLGFSQSLQGFNLVYSWYRETILKRWSNIWAYINGSLGLTVWMLKRDKCWRFARPFGQDFILGENKCQSGGKGCLMKQFSGCENSLVVISFYHHMSLPALLPFLVREESCDH